MSLPSDPSPNGAAAQHAAPPGGLPLPLTSFIGRERELATLREAILAEGIRLVTLIGPGGVGKTRLAIRIAGEIQTAFPDGVWFIALAPVRDPALVASSIAQALGVREGEDLPIQDLIVAHLRERRSLLILDNFEQIIEAAPLVADLLAACPRIKILVTSRATLRVSGEHAITLPPLTLPGPGGASVLDDLRASEAGRLFVARAAAARSGFALTETNGEAVAAICRRLDGLALAIELAAARIAAFSPDLLLARLDERLPLLSDGPRDHPARLRSMRDAIAWSYDLLSPADQSLLRRLSVFLGGFTLDAAEAVSGDGETGRREGLPVSSVFDGIASLVGKSLLVPQETARGEARFVMLETIREFAGAQLAGSGERDAIGSRHAAYFLAFAERYEAIPFLPDGERIRDRLDAEYANLRAAFAWLQEQGDADGLLRLAGALGIWSSQRGHLHESRDRLDRAIALGRRSRPVSLAKGLVVLGITVHLTGDEDRALDLVREGRAQATDPYVDFIGLTSCGLITLRLNDLERAAAFQEEALALTAHLGDEAWVELAASSVLGHLGNIAVARGDIDAAESFFVAALDRQRALGFEPGTSHAFASHPIAGLGDVARARGDHAAALANYQEALLLARRFHDTRATIYALGGVAGALAAAGNWNQAAQLFGAAETQHETAGIHFDLETMDRQRALGLPEPWQRASDPFGAGQPLRDALTHRGNVTLPAIPDPDAAARHWAKGRSLSVEAAIAAAARARIEPPGRIAGLTARELEVLRLLAAGKTDREIGAALFISRRTAATHVRHVLAKLEVSSRAAAAACAVRLGLA